MIAGPEWASRVMSADWGPHSIGGVARMCKYG